jgi:hypothetical protein
VNVRVSPDFDETELPHDVREAFDHGVQESKAKLNPPDLRPGQSPTREDASRTDADPMAKLQSAIDRSFAGLRAPCAQFLDKRRSHHSAPAMTASARDDQEIEKPVSFSSDDDDSATIVTGGWIGPQWIQIGVFDRAATSEDKLRELWSKWPQETAGLSEKTESISRRGKVEHVALVGPFENLAEARAFCAKLKTLGSACNAKLTDASGAKKRSDLLGLRHRACAPDARRGASACREAAARDVGPPAPNKQSAPAGVLTQAKLVSGQSALDMDAGLRGRLTE